MKEPVSIAQVYAWTITGAMVITLLIIISLMGRLTTVKTNYADLESTNRGLVYDNNRLVEASEFQVLAYELIQEHLAATQALVTEANIVLEMLEEEIRWATAKKNQHWNELQDANNELETNAALIEGFELMLDLLQIQHAEEMQQADNATGYYVWFYETMLDWLSNEATPKQVKQLLDGDYSAWIEYIETKIDLKMPEGVDYFE